MEGLREITKTLVRLAGVCVRGLKPDLPVHEAGAVINSATTIGAAVLKQMNITFGECLLLFSLDLFSFRVVFKNVKIKIKAN